MGTFPAPPSPMWLSHHDADQHDRCATVAGRLVCRRCLVLYPGMLAVAAVQLAGAVPADLGVALMWVMPLAVVGEWIGEQVGNLAYSARRQVVTTALASVSFGVALGRHVRHPFELAATAPAITFTVVCLLAWFVGARRHDPGTTDWEAEFEAAEDDRLDALLALLDERGVEEADVDQPASYTKSMSSSTAPTSDGSRSL